MYRRLFVSIVEKSFSQARACCCHYRHNEQEYEHDCKCNDDCIYKQCSDLISGEIVQLSCCHHTGLLRSMRLFGVGHVTCPRSEVNIG